MWLRLPQSACVGRAPDRIFGMCRLWAKHPMGCGDGNEMLRSLHFAFAKCREGFGRDDSLHCAFAKCAKASVEMTGECAEELRTWA